MSKNLFLTFSIPSPSIASPSNKEFHRWYRRHLTEVLESSSWHAGRRYALEDIDGTSSLTSYPFLAAFEVGDDPSSNMQSLKNANAARKARAGYESPPDWAAENRYAAWNCISLEDRGDISLPEHMYLEFTTTPSDLSFDDYSAVCHQQLEEDLLGTGFIRGWRFQLLPTPTNDVEPEAWTHLAIYEVTGEIRALLQERRESRTSTGFKADDRVSSAWIVSVDAFAVTQRVGATRWKRDESDDWVKTKSKRNADNERVVREFRENAGEVSDYSNKYPVLLLHNKGAKTGVTRITPLACLKVENNLAVFGTSGGAPRPPDWYFNLLANPRTTVEFGTETFEVVARFTAGVERKQIWERQKVEVPGFAHLDEVTTREIPVVLLERTTNEG